MTLKRFLKSIAPPFAIDIYRFLRWGSYWNAYCDGIYPSFRDVPTVGSGFSDAGYAIPTIEGTRRAILAVRNYRAIPTQVMEEDDGLGCLWGDRDRFHGVVARLLDTSNALFYRHGQRPTAEAVDLQSPGSAARVMDDPMPDFAAAVRHELGEFLVSRIV